MFKMPLGYYYSSNQSLNGHSALLSGFALLALIPYAVFCGACFLSGSNRGRAIATLVVCALATAFALYFYGNLIFLNPGSMSGLVFLLVPFYQLPAAILLLVVMFFTRPRSRSSSNACCAVTSLKVSRS